jgi:hypothetical protein
MLSMNVHIRKKPSSRGEMQGDKIREQGNVQIAGPKRKS